MNDLTSNGEIVAEESKELAFKSRGPAGRNSELGVLLSQKDMREWGSGSLGYVERDSVDRNEPEA